MSGCDKSFDVAPQLSLTIYSLAHLHQVDECEPYIERKEAACLIYNACSPDKTNKDEAQHRQGSRANWGIKHFYDMFNFSKVQTCH